MRFARSALLSFWVLVIADNCLGAAAGADVKVDIPIRFADTAGAAREQVASVSAALAAGVVRKPGELRLFDEAGGCVSADTRVLSSHPDGSVRRAMLRFPLSVQADKTRVLRLTLDATPQPDVKPLASQATDGSWQWTAAGLSWRLADGTLQVSNPSTGNRVAELKPFGPGFDDFQGRPRQQIIESGGHFLWLSLSKELPEAEAVVEVQADSLGHVLLVARLRSKQKGDVSAPEFGWGLSAHSPREASFDSKRLLEGTSTVNVSDVQTAAGGWKTESGAISLCYPNADNFQRGAIETRRSGTSFSQVYYRLRKEEGVPFQEGSWLTASVAMAPVPVERLVARYEHPLVAVVPPEVYDAVYHCGHAPDLKDPTLKAFYRKVLDMIAGMTLRGDDYGNLVRYNPHCKTGYRFDPQDRANAYGTSRLNHCGALYRIWWQTGDARMRQRALNWCENSYSRMIYWGPEQKYYGGSRYPNFKRASLDSPVRRFALRGNRAVDYCHKGYHNFWLAYEETGDPRMKAAALATDAWAARHVHANSGGQCRNIGIVLDFIKMYEYTGDRECLAQAKRVFQELTTVLTDENLFTQHGKPPTGNGRFIANDKYGYRYPFYKAYMTQYATNSLPLLYRHVPDMPRLRETIRATNDWMARVQKPIGGWSYPAPGSPGVCLSAWTAENVRGMLLAGQIVPSEDYLDAAARNLRARLTIFRSTGFPSGRILPFEYTEAEAKSPDVDHATSQAKTLSKLQQRYEYEKDRDHERDYTDGRLVLKADPEGLVFIPEILSMYLAQRDEKSLLARNKYTAYLEELAEKMKKEP